MKLAILDDYLSVALKVADWSAIEQHAKISVFTEHLGDEDQTALALADFDIVIVMRERTRFPDFVIDKVTQTPFAGHYRITQSGYRYGNRA